MGYLSDMWRYDIPTATFRYIVGSNITDAGHNQTGTCWPSSRSALAVWPSKFNANEVYLGLGYGDIFNNGSFTGLNDVYIFNRITASFRFISGEPLTMNRKA
jgi:hypothetical protein